MVKVAVTGAAGRMGGLIARLVNEADGMLVGAGLERPEHPSLGEDLGLVAGYGKADVPLTCDVAAAMESCDVLVDFTTAEVSLNNIEIVAKAKKAIVIGSTGFTPEEKESIRARNDCRIFFTPNMSVGMNILFKLVHEAARLLGEDYDVEIVETHHRFKKDAPSGSAKRLAEEVANALGLNAASDCVNGREGIVGERTAKEIGMHAVRAGDVVGDHTVIFGTLGERLELTHKASSRETFARGAVKAAEWIVTQPPGVYEMMDLLNLK
ncbi:MAG: 4-hydroxy-tetrahydrodipicolinate reductase [Deltaproteobacteria bacterium]|nr:MAG: 4-hydroxy-tetrahydrodipicolinate reductase [Deltaproteobacteria bacterium]